MNELNDFCLDTENDQKNYNLALWYEKQGHTAAAHTYYLRASERSQDKVLAYKALIRASFCYKKQGSREGTEKVLMESALITLPERPEAYYFLSQRYEKYGDWQNCYIYADLGLQCYERNSIEDIDISEYSGKHLLIYQKMIASWPWGKGKETRELSQLLRDKYYHLMDDQHKTRINENMEKFGLQPTTTNKKIVDAFIFFNEFDVLKLRLDYLNDVVDNFIICESNYTFSGKPKPYHLDEIWEQIPEEIRNKIIRLKYEPNINEFSFPKNVDTFDRSNDIWKLEFKQRDYITDNLSNFSKNDIFILSDCDEIPDKHIIKNIVDDYSGGNLEVALEVKTFYYDFNTILSNYIIPCPCITTINNAIEKGGQTLREQRIHFPIISSAGWHFSYFGGVDTIKSKIEAYAHQEYNKTKYTDNILNSIKNKKDLFERGEMELQTYDFNNFPEDLQNSIKKFYSVEEESSTERKKIIDCFRFFNEKELLELRFNMLKDHVDKFVILEGTRTQSGVLREELLAKKYIKELGLPEDKFIVLEVELPGNDEDIENIEDDIAFRSLSGRSNDSYKNSLNARTRERLLLNSLLTITDQFDDKTVFFVSDCDEIIKPENIPYFSDMALANQDCLVKIPLIELEGKANLRAYNAETNAPVCVDNVFFICTTSHFKIATPFQMRFNINNPYPTVYITQDDKRIEECGWHFSWMGDNNRLKLKQKSTSHYADRIDGAVYKDMNSKELEEFIDQWKPSVGGINPWGYKGYVLKEYPVEDLPTQILEHEHLRKFFLLENNFSKIVDMYLSDQKIQSNTVERNDLINVLIQKINAKKYLEIGVSNGQNLAKINCKYKVGVDPDTNSPATFHITSDEFFKNNNEKFDIIFIDGLHHADQVLRDILNSLEVLNDNGYIVCHDMNPVSKEHQLIPARPGIWNGDCWKAFVELRSTRDDLETYVVNTDHGCGIIKKGKQNAINITEELTYENFDKNRKKWLNIIEVPEFKKIINHEHETLENTYYVFKDSNNYDVSFTIEENVKHDYSSLIRESLEYAKNGESALPEWMLNMEGMSGKKYRNFINRLISLMPDPRYLEIGCWTGSTAVSAMYSNDVNATLIDNFSEDFGDYKQTFFSNLERCKAKNVEFINKNFKNVKYPADKKYNVYFYDGPHSEQDQCDALTIPYDSLDDEFIFICDDWCWDSAVIGTLKGIEKLNLEVLYSIQIKTSNYLTGYDNQNTCQNSDWHNGYYIAVCRKPKNRPIPVIGVPIVNGVHWLKRLINSVDYPVKDFFIINNNGRDQITTELDQLCNINHDYIENIKVCHLPSNIGVSAAWNLIIKSYVMEPYWIICNNDVSFTPGFLEEMVTKSKNVEVGVVHPPSINRDMASYGIGSFECFLLKSGVVEQCGLFDENLYPAYCEDCDYILKMKKNKIKNSFVNSDYYHGDMLDKDYYQQGWGGSRTSNEEGDVLKKKILDFHMLNKQYLKDVWGDDWEKWDKFADSNYIPCEKENKSYGLNFIKTKYLGF